MTFESADEAYYRRRLLTSSADRGFFTDRGRFALSVSFSLGMFVDDISKWPAMAATVPAMSRAVLDIVNRYATEAIVDAALRKGYRFMSNPATISVAAGSK